MLEVLTNWIKYIVFIVLFATFLELLLPNNNLQRFIRLILGLFIMLTILNPIIFVMQNGFTSEKIAVFAGSSTQPAAIAEETDTIIKERERLSIETYKKELVKQIQAIVLSVEGVADADIVLDINNISQGESAQLHKLVKSITVYVKPSHYNNDGKIAVKIKDNEPADNLPLEISTKITNLLSELYQLPKEQIQVKLLHS